MSFWIADGEFSGQAAEDLAALYDEQNDRDYTPDENPNDWHDAPEGSRSEAELYEQEFTDPFAGKIQ